MSTLLVWREKLQEIYAKYSTYILKALQLILGLVLFGLINANIGFMKMASSVFCTVGLAVICTFFPMIIMVTAAAVLILVVLLANTAYSSIYSLKVKIYLIWVTVLLTMIIPVLVMLLLKSYHKISDSELTSRRERFIPVSAVIACYVLCGVAILRVPFAGMLGRFMFAAAACALVGMLVTFFWKISLHMISIGGLLALLCALHTAGLGQLYSTLLIFIILAGLLGSARLWFGSHNLAQVVAGLAAGFIVALLLILFI